MILEQNHGPEMPRTPRTNASEHTPSYDGKMNHVWTVHALHLFVLVFNFIMLMLWALDVKLLEIPLKDVSFFPPSLFGNSIRMTYCSLVRACLQSNQYCAPIYLHVVYRRAIPVHSDHCEQ